MEFRGVLLGATKEGTLVFANIHVGGEHRNHFSVSFDEVRPVEVTDEYLKENVVEMIEGMGALSTLEMLEAYDCRPSELVDYYMRDLLQNYGVDGILDISLYPESFSIKGYDDEIYFESEGCGQHDTRDILIPIDLEFSEWLHSLWYTYHLQQLTEEEYGNISRVIEEYLSTIEEYKWIKEWLIENEELWS
jgi:hypothetical protein